MMQQSKNDFLNCLKHCYALCLCCDRFIPGVLQMKLNPVKKVAPGVAAILVQEMLNLSSQALILMATKPVSHDET